MNMLMNEDLALCKRPMAREIELRAELQPAAGSHNDQSQGQTVASRSGNKKRNRKGKSGGHYCCVERC